MNVVDPPVTYIKVYVTVNDTTVSYAPADNTLQAAIILDDLKVNLINFELIHSRTS